MSVILKSEILQTGQLANEIYEAINHLEVCDGNFPIPTDPCDSMRLYADRLADAISAGVARGVQEYLNQAVKTINIPTLENTDVEVRLHTHPNEEEYGLRAP